MGHLVCVALRNEEAGAAFFEALDVDRRPRRDDEPPHRHRLGDEAVEVVVGDGRVKPDSDLRDIRGRRDAVDDVPDHVVARAMDAGARLLENVADRGAEDDADGDRVRCDRCKILLLDGLGDEELFAL